eukprot:symbB.v1.2.015430.t2/scaffold1153.1/size135008/1
MVVESPTGRGKRCFSTRRNGLSSDSWAELKRIAGPTPTERVFEMKERLFEKKTPELKFWHDAAGWCPHCMVSWVVLEELRIPYVMDTTPLRAYLKPGEKKKQRMVPVIQLIDDSVQQQDGRWQFQDPMKHVGRGEEVCQMLVQRFPSHRIAAFGERRPTGTEWQLFKQLQRAHSAFKRTPGGKPTWGVAVGTQHIQDQLTSALDDLERALETGATGAFLMLGTSMEGIRGFFLNGVQPHMIDLMLLPMLERVEALLLHPNLSQLPSFTAWPRCAEMLEEGRRPGVCSFGELCSDAETLLAISLREDPGRTPKTSLEKTILEPKMSLTEAAEAALQHSPAARRAAAALVVAKHQAVAAFALGGRGCGRSEVVKVKKEDVAEVDAALRSVVKELDGRKWQRVLLKGRRDSVQEGGLRLMEGVLRQRPWDEPLKELPRPEDLQEPLLGAAK